MQAHPSNAIVFGDVRIIDLDARTYRDGIDVVVESGQIREVADHPVSLGSARRIDCAGRVMLPGLIDAHVHVITVGSDLVGLSTRSPYLVAAHAARTLADMLHRGFTSVRDAGGADGGLRVALVEGLIEGPRLFPSGLALAQPGGQGDFRRPGEAAIGCPVCRGRRSLTRVVEGPDACRHAVTEEIREGATQIKIMASGGIASGIPIDRVHFSNDELAAIVEETRRAGTYVLAHAYENIAIRRCLAVGVRSIEHASFVDSATATAIATVGAFVVPTLVVFDHLSRTGKAKGRTAQQIAYFEELKRESLASLERLVHAGVDIGHGSDLDGDSQHEQGREFGLKSGVMPAAEVIRCATETNARLIGRSADLGRIAEGYRSDLIVVDGDPLSDVSMLGDHAKVRLVMVGDRIFRNEL